MHAATSLFLSDAEVMSSSKGLSRSSALKQKERFGFRASPSAEVVASDLTMKTRPVLKQKCPTADSTRSIQAPQRNAGSRTSSNDSSASETPSPLGLRG